MSSPLSAVLDAMRSGAGSLDEVARTTGLAPDTVRAAVDHLRRLGRLEATELTSGCPSGGCGSCASGTVDGRAGCGSGGPSPTRSGPVLVQLTLRPH